MSDPDILDSGGGQNPPGVPTPTPQQSLTYAKALGGVAGGPSTILKYAEIISNQKSQRNVLEVKIKKIVPKESNRNSVSSPTSLPRSLNTDDLSELVFEVMNIPFEEGIGVDFYTGRYDTR